MNVAGDNTCNGKNAKTTAIAAAPIVIVIPVAFQAAAAINNNKF